MPELKIIMNPSEIFYNLPTIETERLRLRRVLQRDANDVFEYASNPEVSKYVTWDYHRSVLDSISFMRRILVSYNKGEPAPWGIVFKDDQKLIGTGGYHWWNTEHAIAELGYTISERYWNKGIMTEALEAMIKFGFEKMHLHRIQAKCFTENLPSERVLQKCGMTYEGIMRESMFVKNEFHDLKLYAIIKNS